MKEQNNHSKNRKKKDVGEGKKARKGFSSSSFFKVEEVWLGTPVIAALGVINTRGRSPPLASAT